MNSQFFQNILFNIEKNFFNLKNIDKMNKHVFIFGLARSGTTILLNSLYSTNEYASTLYKDMPFVLSPNFWSKINIKQSKDIKKAERLHKDNILIDLNSPEALDEIFWKFILKNSYIKSNYLAKHTLKENELYNFTIFIEAYLKKYNKERYLSKNNNNILRCESLIKFFKNSKFLIVFRKPNFHVKSLYEKHLDFKKIQLKDPFVEKYMNFLGHHEFGFGHKIFDFSNNSKNNYDLNNASYWIDLWKNYYTFSLKFKGYNNVMFLSYEKFCSDPFRYVNSINEKDNNNDFSQIIENKNLKFDENFSDQEANNIYEELLLLDKF